MQNRTLAAEKLNIIYYANKTLKIDDFEQWLPLWAGYLQFYETDLSTEITELVFERLCDENEKQMGGFLAIDGENAIGLVHFIIHRNTWSDKDVCYLEDLFVSPENRGGGVGRALINSVGEFARENNLRHVYWQTNKLNDRAQILYEKMAGPSEFIVYKMKI